MRCDCCNRALSDYESTLRHATTGEFINTCNTCLQDLNIPTKGREDLSPYVPGEEDFIDDFDMEDDV